MSDHKASPEKSTGRNTQAHRNPLVSRNAMENNHSPTVKGSECPFIVEFVMVQGINFVCMAYLDKNDVWRNAYNNNVLLEPIRVLG